MAADEANDEDDDAEAAVEVAGAADEDSAGADDDGKAMDVPAVASDDEPGTLELPALADDDAGSALLPLVALLPSLALLATEEELRGPVEEETPCDAVPAEDEPTAPLLLLLDEDSVDVDVQATRPADSMRPWRTVRAGRRDTRAGRVMKVLSWGSAAWVDAGGSRKTHGAG